MRYYNSKGWEKPWLSMLIFPFQSRFIIGFEKFEGEWLSEHDGVYNLFD